MQTLTAVMQSILLLMRCNIILYVKAYHGQTLNIIGCTISRAIFFNA